MRNLSITFAAMMLTGLSGYLHAGATTQPTTNTVVMDATDLKGLTAAAGKTVTVRGKGADTWGTSPKMVLRITFKDANGGFSAVILNQKELDAVNAKFDGDVRNAVEKKTLLVTGEIKMYKDYPQQEAVPRIEVTKPDQIQIESK